MNDDRMILAFMRNIRSQNTAFDKTTVFKTDPC